MANTIQQLVVTLGADTTGFEQGFSKAEDLAHHFGLNFNKVMGGLTFTAAIAGLVEVGEKFEQADFKIQRATGATGERLDAFQKSLRNIYATSGKSADEIAEALSKISIKTGETGAQLEALTRSSLKFAKVTSSDLSSSIEENQKVFAQWGIVASEQAEKLDKLYVISTQTGIGASQLAQTMLSSGAALRSFGFSFDEAASLVGNFAKHGLDLNNVLGALSRGMVNLADSGKNPREELLRLVDQMRRATSEAAAVDLAAGTFGKRGAVVLSDAVRRGAFDTEHLSDALKDAKGKVSEIADETKTFGERWKQLQHQLEVAAEPAGNFIVKWANDGIAGMNNVFAVFNAIGPTIFRATKGEDLPLPFPIGYSESRAAHRRATSGGAGGGGGGGKGLSLDEAFSALHLKDLRKELADSEAAFRVLAGSGKLTQDQMLQAAGAIQKLRDQLAGLRHLDLAEILPSGPTLEQLQNLPGGLHGGVTQDDLAALPTYSHGIDLINDSLAAMANEWALNARNAEIVSDAFHAFGLKTPQELQDMAAQSEEAYNILKDSGQATAQQLDEAFTQYKLNQIELDHILGVTDDEVYAQQKKNAEDTLKVLRGEHVANDQRRRDQYDMGREMEQMSHRAFDSLERDLARNLVEWKNWSDTIKNIGKNLAEDFLSIMLKGLFKRLEDQFAKLAGKIGGWLGGIFGGGGGAAQTAGGVAGAAGSAGGAGAAAAAGGWVGIAQLGVSVASGIVSGIQGARTNNLLAEVELNTRSAFNELTNLRADSWMREDHLMRKLDDIWNSIRNVGGVAGGGDSMNALGSIRDYARLLVAKFDEFVIPKMDVMIGQLNGAAPGGNGVYFDFRGATFTSVSQDQVEGIMTKVVRQVRAAGGFK